MNLRNRFYYKEGKDHKRGGASLALKENGSLLNKTDTDNSFTVNTNQLYQKQNSYNNKPPHPRQNNSITNSFNVPSAVNSQRQPNNFNMSSNKSTRRQTPDQVAFLMKQNSNQINNLSVDKININNDSSYDSNEKMGNINNYPNFLMDYSNNEPDNFISQTKGASSRQINNNKTGNMQALLLLQKQMKLNFIKNAYDGKHKNAIFGKQIRFASNNISSEKSSRIENHLTDHQQQQHSSCNNNNSFNIGINNSNNNICIGSNSATNNYVQPANSRGQLMQHQHHQTLLKGPQQLYYYQYQNLHKRKQNSYHQKQFIENINGKNYGQSKSINKSFQGDTHYATHNIYSNNNANNISNILNSSLISNQRMESALSLMDENSIIRASSGSNGYYKFFEGSVPIDMTKIMPNNYESAKNVSILNTSLSSKSPSKINQTNSYNVMRNMQQSVLSQELVKQAKKLFKENDLPKAIELFKESLVHDPNCLEGKFMLAVSYLSQSSFPEAIKYFQQVREENPNFKRNIYLLESIAYKKMNDIENSINILNKALKKFPKYIEAYIYRGKLMIKEKQWERGLQDFQAATNLNPNSGLAYLGKADCLKNLKQYQKAIETYSKASEVDPKLKCSAILKRAITYIEQNNIELATNDLLEVEKVDPCNSELLYFKGVAAYKSKNYQDAILSFEQSIKHNNSKKAVTQSLFGIARFHIENRDFYAAYHTLSRGEYLQIEKTLLEKYRLFTEFVIFLMKRKYQDALDNCKLIFTDKQEVDSQLKLGGSNDNQQGSKKNEELYIAQKQPYSPTVGQQQQQQQQISSSLQCMKQQLPLKSSGRSVKTNNISRKSSLDTFLIPMIHKYRAYGNFCLGKHKEALLDYEQLQKEIDQLNEEDKSEEKDNGIQYNTNLCKGIISVQEGDLSTGLHHFNIASKLFANKVEPLFYRSVTLIKLALMEEDPDQRCQTVLDGLRELDKAIELNDSNANLYYFRAIMHCSLGYFNEGVHDVDKAIEKSEDNVPKYFFLRGHIFGCCKSYKQAVNDLSICISLDQQFKEAYMERAKNYGLLEDYMHAVEDVQYMAQSNNINTNINNNEKKENIINASNNVNESDIQQDKIKNKNNNNGNDKQVDATLNSNNCYFNYWRGNIMFCSSAYEEAIKIYSQCIDNINSGYYNQNGIQGNTNNKNIAQSRRSSNSLNQKNNNNNNYYNSLIKKELILYQRGKCNLNLLNLDITLQDFPLVVEATKNEDIEFDTIIVRALYLASVKGGKNYQNSLQLLEKLLTQGEVEEGKIFLKHDLYFFVGVLFFYNQKYDEAIDMFSQSLLIKEQYKEEEIKLKKKQNQLSSSLLMPSSSERKMKDEAEETEFQETKIEMEQQVYRYDELLFNIGVCYLMLRQFIQAKDTLEKIGSSLGEIQKDYYNVLMRIIQHEIDLQSMKSSEGEQADIKTESQQFQVLQVFPCENKLSKCYSTVKIPFTSIDNLEIKLSFDIPKVPTPNLQPYFNTRLLEQFEITDVDNKPEAPWIKRTQDGIVFTDNVQVFENLDLDTEDRLEKSEQQNQDPENNDIDFDELDENFEKQRSQKALNQGDLTNSDGKKHVNITQLKQNLALDKNIEEKLNKLMKKQQKQKSQ